MTDTPINPDPRPSPLVADVAMKRASRWKKATLAGLLSFVFSGMGQLYNRQPRKAFGLALISCALGMLLVKTRVLLTFSTMVATILISALWKLFVTTDAAYAATQPKNPEFPLPLPRLTYPLLAALFFVAALIPTANQIRSDVGFAAFKVPTASMCPTICPGERFVADLHAYRTEPPQRGDLILIKNSSSDSLLVKRVVGIAGDTVSPGADGSVLVNGQQFHPPAPCGAPAWQKEDSADYSIFQSTTVPKGTFFVVGDDLAASFDSRYPEFGAATLGMVKGRPLYLYWSPGKSRIGCRLH
jgi:signal peptidase I